MRKRIFWPIQKHPFNLKSFYMKKAKFIFPLMFAIALTGSAFSRSSAANGQLAFYQDPWMDDCTSTSLPGGQCVTDPANYICEENIIGMGAYVMYQSGVPGICYQPYYSYTP
jgi:hypothetical protein